MASRIREVRIQIGRDRGLVQERLAPLLDVSTKTISRWETAESKPSRANLAKLAELAGVTPTWIEYGIQPDQAPIDERPIAEDDALARAFRVLATPERWQRRIRDLRQSKGSPRMSEATLRSYIEDSVRQWEAEASGKTRDPAIADDPDTGDGIPLP